MKINPLISILLYIFCLCGSTTQLIGQAAIIDSKTLLIASNSVPTESSNDTLFYWNQNKRTLRVGIFENGKANENSTAFGSTAFGRNNHVGGTFASAFGTDQLVQGSSAMVWGRNNQNYGSHGTVWGLSNQARDKQTTVFGIENDARKDNATAWGYSNVVDAQSATAWGENNQVTASNATVTGKDNISTSPSSLTIGEYNIPFDQLDGAPHDSMDFLFVVGNGVIDQRSNAMIINKSGHVGIGTDLPQDQLHIQEGKLRLGDTTTIGESNGILTTNSSFIPQHPNLDLGSMDHKWGTIYANNGVIQTSDIRFKTNITLVGSVIPSLLELKPIAYQLQDSNDRSVHTGLSAQAVELIFPHIVSKMNTGNDDLPESDTYGLNYTELIPILIKAIQEQQKMIETLNNKISKQ